MPLNRLAALLLSASALVGCSAVDRLANVGRAPELSAIENPTQAPTYQPVTLPMPRPEPLRREANSLWRPGARAFFKDQRASRVGDILTVDITISDEATINNETTRSRAATEEADLTNFLGYEGSLGQVLPEAVNPASLVSLGSTGTNAGKGSVNRKEEISLEVAAIVTQVLPNGNLVVRGSQEVRVNFEVRVLQVTGVVRPEDISAVNVVNHTQMAEARISYGGRGQLTDVQQPRYGQQVYDIIFPF